MKGGPNRRGPRNAGPVSPGRLTIEREKIRHRRPNDLAFDEADEPPPRQYPDEQPYNEQPHHDVADEDWTSTGETYESSSWDDDSGDEWPLDDVDQPDDSHELDDDGGIIWEDEPSDPVLDDRIPGAFDREQEDHGFAPEVELAGRRDVRPRAPKPPQRQRAPHRPQRTHGQVQQLPPVRDDNVDHPQEPEPDTDGFSRPPSEDHGRFARTRATISGDAASSPIDADEEVLRPQNRAASSRRRQGHPKQLPPAPPGPLMRVPSDREKRGKKYLMILIVLTLVGVGAWFAYQTWGQDGFGPMISRLTETINLPGSKRTAADTSFDDPVPPEEALANLSRAEQKDEQATASPSPPALEIDPATLVKDGPPLPKFKPLDAGSTRSVSQQELTDLQVTDGEDSGDDSPPSSIFERLWHLFKPG